jgi:hypothetical protein
MDDRCQPFQEHWLFGALEVRATWRRNGLPAKGIRARITLGSVDDSGPG